MNLSRREFVAYSAAAVSIPAGMRPPAPRHDCLVLPVPGQCSLPESVVGYRSALTHLKTSLLVIPAVLEMPQHLRSLISNRLQAGGTVLVESGGGFATDATFARHRRSLRDVLDIEVGAPVNLWAGVRGAPYIDYTWPHPAKIRDFSRAVSVADPAGDVIGRADGLSVALRRGRGSGTLIFLGSPLGPALWAGDAEARRWLSELATSAPRPAYVR